MNLGITRCGNMEFKWGERTYVMGIVNLSPDSFSGDGLKKAEDAASQARRMVSEGADILDIGGESTRPGAVPISVEEELKRVIPAIEKIASQVSVPVSIDSYKYEVVDRALKAGAAMVNDQWGLKKEPRLALLAAEKGVPIILMSNMRDEKFETLDIISLIVTNLQKSIKTARQFGIPLENIIIDPGIGFVGPWQNNLEIIRRLDELKKLERPVLLGPSRKSFIKMILDLPTSERLEGTSAAVAIGISKGADMVRVHDVRQIARVCKVSDAIVRKII